MTNDQTIKADAGKPCLSLVPWQIAYDIAGIQRFDYEQEICEAPFLIHKTRKVKNNWLGLFRCNCCGTEFEAYITNVARGKTRSCGCMKGKFLVDSKGTHGESKTRLYRIFAHIKERCNNQNCKEYKWYGGKGVTCNFGSFEEFRDFAYSHGYNDALTVDRVDVNGNYSSDNIRFIPLKLQARNTTANVKINYKGVELCAAEWADILGVQANTLTKRKRSGWDDDRTIETPTKNSKFDIMLVPMQIINDIMACRVYGNDKYGDSESWKRVDRQRYIDALLRHVLAFATNPESVDEESGIEHYKHAACNMAFLSAMMMEGTK